MPCVVKAPDRQGQRGLTLVQTRAELPAAVAEAIDASRGGSCLVEELVDGPEVTVNAISRGGEFTPLTVTDRLTAEPPAFGVALAHVWPSEHDPGEVVRVAAAAARRARDPERPDRTRRSGSARTGLASSRWRRASAAATTRSCAGPPSAST